MNWLQRLRRRSARSAAGPASITPDARWAADSAPAQAAVPPPQHSRLLAAIALQALLIIGLSWALVYFARDEYDAITEREEEEIETPSRLVTQAGEPSAAALIKLAPGEQRVNGIETRPLQTHRHADSGTAYGSVVDMAGLFDLRAKYFAALDEARVVRAQLARSEAEYRRADALYRDDRSVAQRVVQEAQAALRADQAKLAAANRLAQDIVPALRQQWGEPLAQWATQANQAMLARLTNKQEVLVQIALPSGQAPAQLELAPLSGEGAPVVAQLIGPAPRADERHGGMTFFYRASAGSLRLGMPVSVRVGEGAQAAQGVAVPREAVLWHGGKAWVYVKQSGDAYARQVLSTPQPIEEGYFVVQGFSAGQEVVISGAQLLLSEEFRYQIRNENDD